MGLLITLISHFNTVFSQTLNWKLSDSTNHILNANVGLDYSVSYAIGYGYKLNTKLPIVLNANFSLPSGENLLDDFKTKIGGQICLVNKSNFVGAVSLFGIYRKYQTGLVRIQNFGSDIKGTFGYYKKSWFIATEIGFDKAIVTHFKHTQKYKDEIYADVVDGWYEASTGGNFYYGLQGGYSFKKLDMTINIGKVVSQDFKTAPFLPFYLNLGVNYRIFK
ncbi:MAG: hypothetical protein EAY81_02520 [Bacteroidetes bacterium]|nr:MAG: hypothetical protein EAY81_02520 [Bacteroidota bacterium]